jgi:two-component system OmpR family response regulator
VKKPVVLCVDDEESGLLVRANILQLHGYEVLTARTGRAALELFAAQGIDAVVLDFCMPDLQGDMLANAMKRARSDVPIILLTAYVSVPEQTTRLVDKVVVKAQHPSVLLAALSECMREREHHHNCAKP